MLAIVPSMEPGLPLPLEQPFPVPTRSGGRRPSRQTLLHRPEWTALGSPLPDHRRDVAVTLPVTAVLVPGPLRLPDDLRIVRGAEVCASTIRAGSRSQVVEVALLVAASGWKLVLHGPHPSHPSP